MKIIGTLFRFLISINTIWGLMILTAFVLCVVQHYLPTTSLIPLSSLAEGENALNVRVIDPNSQAHDFAFTLLLRDGQPELLPADCAPSMTRPWLISAVRRGEYCGLTWDTKANGSYQVLVGARAIAAGKLVTLQSLTDAAFNYAETGFKLALGLVASMVLFLGLMRVGQDAGIVQLLARVMHPVIRFLFPQIPKDHPASGAILMNWTTTLLGLGNAATPFGLKAMKELQSLNPHPDTASDSQVMLLGYNTAGLALVPTQLLAYRKSAGCSDPFEILGTCLLAGTIATIAAIVMVKVLGSLPVFSIRLGQPVAGGSQS